MSLHDIIVDCWEEELIEAALKDMPGKLVMSRKDPGEPFIDDNGFLTVRVKDVEDPQAFARDLQRRVRSIRVIGIVDREADRVKADPEPGSYRAQALAGLLGKEPNSPKQGFRIV